MSTDKGTGVVEQIRRFDIATAAEDFAAPGRSIEVKDDDRSSRPGSHFSERHIWIEVHDFKLAEKCPMCANPVGDKAGGDG